MITSELREKCVNTIRFLAADAIQKANSGHPGAPMGTADIAFVLWNRFLRFNPQGPAWPNRDRFVLSGGHGSMLLYSLLHLSGYALGLEELKEFRQWGSITPGHPEYGMTPGVECTTGPLGTGIGNAVGMALAGKMMGARFNTESVSLVDATIYALCGDGDLQEGVSAEAASFAGHLKLGNLTLIYDSNDITIAGGLKLSMSEDVGKRFEAYGWHVQHCDGHNHEEIAACLTRANQTTLKPSLIIAKTIIGKGAPTKAGTSSIHGSPLGVDELAAAKKAAGWDPERAFFVPQEVRDVFNERNAENLKLYKAWHDVYQKWRQEAPEKAKLWDAHWNGLVPENLLKELVAAVAGKEDATRVLSGQVLQTAAKLVPSLIGGSADLEPSTLTLIKGESSIVPASVSSPQQPDPSFKGRNIHFGIREHAMGAICNGLNLFGSFRSYCSTFAVFSDYMRPTLRLAALSHIPTIFIFTHDSFWVGEDGPTHQPIEQAWALRIIPNLDVWRPADAIETAAAWAYGLSDLAKKTPQALLLTRQNITTLKRAADFKPEEIWKGGYLVAEAEGAAPKVVLLGTGSENGVLQTVREKLQQSGIPTRHVSMPCLERFLAQPQDYQRQLLPKSAVVIAVEAGVSGPWYQFADYVIGRDDFGLSAPGKLLAEKFGFTAEPLTDNIKAWLETNGTK
ncbi:transketolase [Deltaproteobacteria bacterium TL4]